MTIGSCIGPNIRAAIGERLRGFTGVLDQYPGAEAAYSLLDLTSAWVGQDVILARRSSDNAELGFNAKEVANGTLTEWAGAGDAFVKTWYDQSGNGNNLSNVTDAQQRKIVDTGVLVTEGGDAAIAGNIYGYSFDSSVILSGAFSMLTLANIGAGQASLGGETANPRIRYFATSLEVVNNSAGEVNFLNSDNAPTSHTFDGTRVLTGLYRDASDAIDFTIAGQEIATAPLTLSGTFTFTRALARNSDLDPLNGNIQELIIWPSDIR